MQDFDVDSLMPNGFTDQPEGTSDFNTASPQGMLGNLSAPVFSGKETLLFPEPKSTSLPDMTNIQWPPEGQLNLPPGQTNGASQYNPW